MFLWTRSMPVLLSNIFHWNVKQPWKNFRLLSRSTKHKERQIEFHRNDSDAEAFQILVFRFTLKILELSKKTQYAVFNKVT